MLRSLKSQGFNIIDDYSHIPTAAASLALSPDPSPTSGEGSSSMVRELEGVCKVEMLKPYLKNPHISHLVFFPV